MKRYVFITCLMLAFQASAQVNPELKALIRQSLIYFPRLKELEKSTAINEARVEIAKGAYQPSVTGNATYNYIDPISQSLIPIGPTETRLLQFQPHNNYNAYIGLNQVIWDFGRTQAQIDKAKIELQLNQYSTDAAQLQLASQVVGIYYGLIYFKKSIEVQDTVLRFYEQNRKIVEGKIKEGDALQVDLMNIDNSIEQEKSRKVEFERLYDRQIALLRYTSGAEALPQDSLFDFAPQGLVTVENNPDLQAANQRVLSSQADEKLATSNRLPSINFVANAGIRNGYQPDIEEIRFNYLVGASLSLPIFQGRRLENSLRLSRHSRELSEQSKITISSTLEKDFISAKADADAYTKQIEHAQAQFAAAKESLRLNRVRYEKGVATYLDLVYASTNLQRVMLNELQYEYQRCLALAEIARLTGNKFWQD